MADCKNVTTYGVGGTLEVSQQLQDGEKFIKWDDKEVSILIYYIT